MAPHSQVLQIGFQPACQPGHRLRRAQAHTQLYFMMGILVWCVSCTSPPSIIAPELRATIDANASFPLVIEDPQRFIGKTVLWGGTILKTTVRKDGSLLEILQRPLNTYDEPHVDAQSE